MVDDFFEVYIYKPFFANLGSLSKVSIVVRV